MYSGRVQGTGSIVQQLCNKEKVGFVDLWDSFTAKEDINMRDGLHSWKGAGVFADELKLTVGTGLSKMSRRLKMWTV